MRLGRVGDMNVRPGLQFDVEHVLWRLKDTFPNIEVEEEYHAKTIQGLMEVAKEYPDGGGAVRMARRDAQELGPAYPFRIGMDGDRYIKGTIARFVLSFRYEGSGGPKEMRERCETFVKSLNPQVEVNL